jgi:hypothetical protein
MTTRHQISAAILHGGSIPPDHIEIAAAIVAMRYCPVKTPRIMQIMGLAKGYDTSADAGQPHRNPHPDA